MNEHPDELAAGSESNLFGLFQNQARQTPAAVAVVSNTGETTYAELLSLANQIRSGLHRLDLPLEEPVGVCMSRTVNMIATILAVVGSGLAHVPMDPASPTKRLQRIIDNSACRVVITDHQSSWLFESEDAAVPETLLSLNSLLGESLQTADIPVPPGDTNRAYIIYTSGSTGIPKGVDTAHRGVINLLTNLRDSLQISAEDRVLAVATTGFDVSVVEIFLPLTSGASILLRDSGIWLTPDILANDLRDHGVTVVQASASTWSMLETQAVELPQFRVALNMGESIPADLAIRLGKHAEHVWNMYGPTEASVYCAIHELSADSSLGLLPPGAPSPIGTALSNVSIHIVDSDGELVPSGVVGELCVGGIAPALGYYRDPSLTAEKFVTNSRLGERVYHTGDLASYDDNGILQFHGRIDDQLKIRGMRIEPGEVEAVLAQHPQISAAAVTWYENSDGLRSMIAALVATNHDREELRDWMAPRLASQMIPSRIAFVSEVPRAPTGKVDRLAIRAMAVESPNQTPQSATPDSDSSVLAVVSAAWREVLGLDVVRGADNFFTLGGDSLAAVRLVQSIEQRLGVSLGIQAVFEAGSLNEMSRQVVELQSQSSVDSESKFVFPIVEAGTGSPLFFGGADLRLAHRGVWTVPSPLYAVAYWAQHRGLAATTSVSELASVQLGAIRSIQAEGPYRLAGYGFGGVVAFEIAQQLRREGHEVEELFLLNPMIPGRASPWWRRGFTKVLNNRLGHLITHEIGHLRERRAGQIETQIVPKKDWPSLFFHSRRLADRYHPGSYEGRVWLGATNDQVLDRWRSFVGSDREERLLDAQPDAFSQAGIAEWISDLERRIGDVEYGDLPLTPNVARFLTRSKAVNHWNISSFLQPDSTIDLDALRTALDAVITHHETLRTRFAYDGAEWSWLIEPQPAGFRGVKFHDLSELDAAARQDALHDCLTAINSGFDLVDGPLFDVSVFDLGPDGQRLVITAHHLVAEAISLRIITDDLTTGYEQTTASTTIRLSSRSASLRRWADGLHDWANSSRGKDAAQFWRSLDWASVSPLRSDGPGGSDALSNSAARQISATLPTEELLATIPAEANNEEWFLTTFSIALAEWSGQSSVMFDRLASGRSPSGPRRLDASRTAGFLLSYSTIVLSGLDDVRVDPTLADVRNFIKRGEELDILRWMSDEHKTKDEFQKLPRSEVVINYRGRSMHPIPADAFFKEAAGDISGYDYSPNGERYAPISIRVDELADGFEIRLIYSCRLYSEASMQQLLETWTAKLRSLVS